MNTSFGSLILGSRFHFPSVFQVCPHFSVLTHVGRQFHKKNPIKCVIFYCITKALKVKCLIKGNRNYSFPFCSFITENYFVYKFPEWSIHLMTCINLSLTSSWASTRDSRWWQHSILPESTLRQYTIVSPLENPGNSAKVIVRGSL
jgi:hypothetical protein